MTNIKDIINDNVNGATFIGLTTSTEPRLLGGKDNPYKGRVRKIMTGANVMVFQNKKSHGYDNMVKRRLEKEGKDPNTFKLSPRTWGHRVPNAPFVEHKGNYYLEVIFLNSGEVHYELDGVIFDHTNVANQKRLGLKLDKNEGHQGGLNDKVIIRTFKIDSITELTINGESYTNLIYI